MLARYSSFSSFPLFNFRVIIVNSKSDISNICFIMIIRQLSEICHITSCIFPAVICLLENLKNEWFWHLLWINSTFPFDFLSSLQICAAEQHTIYSWDLFNIIRSASRRHQSREIFSTLLLLLYSTSGSEWISIMVYANVFSTQWGNLLCAIYEIFIEIISKEEEEG